MRTPFCAACISNKPSGVISRLPVLNCRACDSGSDAVNVASDLPLAMSNSSTKSQSFSTIRIRESSDSEAAPEPIRLNTFELCSVQVAVSQILILVSIGAIRPPFCGNTAGVSCPPVSSHRPSALKDRAKILSLCAANVRSFWPDARSHKSTSPLKPERAARTFWSGLTATEDGVLQTVCFSPLAVNTKERLKGPSVVSGESLGINATENTGVPRWPKWKSATSARVFVSHIFSVSPGNCAPGFVASQRPSLLKTARFAAPSSTLASLRVSRSQIFVPCCEPATSQRPSELTAIPCTASCPENMCNSRPLPESQVLITLAS